MPRQHKPGCVWEPMVRHYFHMNLKVSGWRDVGLENHGVRLQGMEQMELAGEKLERRSLRWGLGSSNWCDGWIDGVMPIVWVW